MSSHVPEKVIELAQAVRAEGGRALLVGGCVRDLLMGGQPKDWDVEVYAVEPVRLRVLRAAQFAARFEFDIEAETVELCRAIDLTDLPRERIWGEMEKLLLRARRPSIGFIWLHKFGALDQLFPELGALAGVPQEKD